MGCVAALLAAVWLLLDYPWGLLAFVAIAWRLQFAPVEVLGLALQVFLHNLIRLFLPTRRDRSDPPMQDALFDSFLANQKRGCPNRLDRHECLRHSDIGASSYRKAVTTCVRYFTEFEIEMPRSSPPLRD